MTQTTKHGTISGTSTGTELVTFLSEQENAEASQHSGTARPSYITAGMLWTKDDATDLWVMFYDGTTDHSIAYYDVSTGVFNVEIGAAFIGTSAPTSHDGRIMFNPTSGILSVYDGSAWEAINTALTKFTEAVFRTVTASFTLLTTDAGIKVLLNPAASMTVTNIADASAPVGYQVSLINRSSQIINLDPSGTQSINGSTATITDCIKPHGAAYLMKVASDDWEFVY